MILVTGATGTVGRNVVAELVAAGAEVRAMSRDPARADLPSGVEVVAGDLLRPETLPAALRGADRAYLFPLAGAVPGFLVAAGDAGIARVVLLSSAAAAMPGANAIGRGHAANEEAVRRSGLAWTFLRPTAFMANDLMWSAAVRAGGAVRAPYGQAATAPVDERDIAAVAAAALLRGGHERRAYELTGPASLTQLERVAILAEVLGRDLRFEELTPDEARQHMRGMPPAILEAYLALFASQVGRQARVSSDVAQVLGRPPHAYREWVAHHARDFAGPSGVAAPPGGG